MDRCVASIGPLRFRLASVESVESPVLESEPFLVLEDGTEVGILRGSPRSVLVIDHRSGPGGLARLEHWDCMDLAETAAPVELLVLADAVRPTAIHAAGGTRATRRAASSPG